MKAWESKNAKRAAQGTALSTMAVTLAACGGSSSDNTPFSQADIDAATTPIQNQLTSTQAQLATASANLTAATAAKTAAESALTTATAAKTAAEAAQAAAEGALATLRTDLGVASDATTTEMMNAITALESTASSATAANAAAQSALADLRADLGVASNATTTEMMAAITALEAGSADAQASLAALRTDLGVAANASTTDMIAAITALETAASNAAAAGATAQTALATLRTDLGVAADATTTEMMAAITALETSAANAAAARDVAEAGLASLRTDLGLAADATVSDMVAAITALENAAATAADAAVAALGIAGITTLAQLNAAYDALANPGITSFTLTANTDNVTGSDVDDTIAGSSSTFNSDDVINGGAGNDTFNLTTAGAGTVIANISGVEVIRVTQGGANNTDYALNMIGASGAVELASRLSTGEVSFDNVQTLATVSAFGTQLGSKVTAGFLNSLASGNSDSVSLKIDGGANTTFQVSGTTDTNEFETINLESAGATKNTVAAIKDAGGNDTAALKTLNVTGSADLDITLAGGATGAVYNAAAASGDQTVTWGGNFTSLTGGSGNDKFDVSAGSFFGNTAPKTVVGGAGDDTLVVNENIANLTSNKATQPHSVSGIETVQVLAQLADGGAADLTRSYAADAINGESTILVTAQNNDGTASDGTGEDVTVNITGVTTETVNVSFKASATANNDEIVTVKMKDDTGASDAVSIESVGVTGQVNSFALTVDRVAATAANKVETVNFIASAADVSTTVGTTLQSLTAAYSSTINLSGSGNLAITTVELEDPTGTATGVIDASKMTGNLTLATGFKTTATDTVTVKLGAGTNSVDFGDEALSADVVMGSSGSDTVKIKEATTDVEMTISGVDTVTLTGAGATKVISAKNFTDVGTINIVDAGANDNGSDNVTVTNISNGQAVVINSDSATKADWDGDAVTLDLATGVTTLAVELKGKVALEGTGVFKTDATTLSLTDSIKGDDGFYESQTVNLEGLSATAKLGTLNLSGGGAASATAKAALTIAGTTNVDLSKIDATQLNSDLVISGVTTKAGASVLLGSGDNKVTVALADLARDAVVINGGNGTDTLVASALDNATYRPGLSSVETLDFTMVDASNGAVTVDLTDTSGVTGLKLDINGAEHGFTLAEGAVSSVTLAGDFVSAGAGTDATIALDTAGVVVVKNSAAVGDTDTVLTLATATGVTIKQGHSSAIDFEALNLTKATSLVLGGKDTDTSGAMFAGAINANAMTAGELTTLTVETEQGAISLASVTAAKLASVTVTGDNAFTFGNTAATTTALASFDASAATGGITIGTAVDFTTAAVVKLGTGSDEITLDILTESGIAVDGGTKTGDTDMLKLVGTNNLGLSVVELSAADQVTQLNGGVNGAIQSNFESVDLSGLTGSFGANIVGSAVANTIIGTSNADNIVAGGGADVINGGGGNDLISLSEGTQVVDTVVAAAGYASVDTITGWDDSDKLDVTTATAQGAKAQTDLDNAVAIGGVANAGKSIVIDADGQVVVIDELVATAGDDTVIIARTGELQALATNILAEIANTTVVLQFDSGTDGVADSTFVISEHAGGAEFAILEGVLLTGVASTDIATELYIV